MSTDAGAASIGDLLLPLIPEPLRPIASALIGVVQALPADQRRRQIALAILAKARDDSRRRIDAGDDPGVVLRDVYIAAAQSLADEGVLDEG